MNKILYAFLFLGFTTGLIAEPKFKPILNGKDLEGWNVPKGNEQAGWYKMVEGVLEIRSGKSCGLFG